jgi:hemoglobin/transferrin/lactoferrin receptor protein
MRSLDGSYSLPSVRTFARSLFLGLSVAALLAAGSANAQETELPGINVQSAKAKKTSAAKSKPKPKPVQAMAPEPVDDVGPAEPQGNAAVEAARVDVPYNTPAGVSVAGSGEIQTFGQGSVDNVLRSMPGVSTRESISNPGVAVNIRGFEGQGRVAMSIDGVRQNFRFLGHEAGGFTYVDPLLLASIEVQRGAVSGVGGSGALAGTADMRTIDVQDVLKAGRDYGALTSITWGSNGVGFSEMAAGAIRSGPISIVGAISKHDEDDYKNGNGVLVPYTHQDLISGLAKAHIQIDPAQRLSFGTVLYNNEFGANSYDQRVDLKIYTANYVYNPLANDLINFRANFSVSDMSMEYLDGVNMFAGSPGRVIDDLGVGVNASNTSLFTLGGGVFVKSTYGYEYYHDDVDAYNKLTPASHGGSNPSGASSSQGVFSETTFSKSIFDLMVGLRYDWFDLSGHGDVQTCGTPPCSVSPPPFLQPGPYSVDKSDSGFSPKVTLTAKPYSWFEPYVTYSESMRFPDASETLAGGSHPNGGSTTLPNPFLEPESQRGWEFGFNTRYDGLFTRNDALRFKADYFTMDVDNYIVGRVYANNITYFINAPGTSKVEGVELQGTYDAGFVFGGFTYAHTHTDLPSQQNGMGASSFVPDDVGTITGGVRMFDEKLTVGARAYLTSKTYKGDVNGGGYWDAYNTVDLFSSYAVTDDITVGLNVTNLMDVAYTPALSTGNTSSNPFAPAVDTGRGRTFLLTTRANF